MMVRGGATSLGATGAAASGGAVTGGAVATGGAAAACKFAIAGGSGFGGGATTLGGAGGGTVNVGRVPGACGVISRGAGGDTAAGEGGDGAVWTGAFAASLGSAGGTGGLATGGAATGACFCVRAFSTSPGREMFERSILVFIPSLSPREAALEPAPLPSPCFRKWVRTFSASSASSELE